MDARCNCNDGWAGDDCSVACPSLCSGRGAYEHVTFERYAGDIAHATVYTQACVSFLEESQSVHAFRDLRAMHVKKNRHVTN